MKPSQTLAGYVRQHLAEIEERLNFGTRQEVIVKELQELGYPTTLRVFRTTLHRARLSPAPSTPSPQPATKEIKKPDPQSNSNPPPSKPGSFSFNGSETYTPDQLI